MNNPLNLYKHNLISFTMDAKSVNDSLMKLREKYGNDYMGYIGKNMTILNEIINNSR